MANILKSYLGICTNEWKAWLDLATFQLDMKQTAETAKSIEIVARIGGAETIEVINSTPGSKASFLAENANNRKHRTLHQETP